MKDNLIKALAFNKHVSIHICSMKTSVEKARQRFDMWPTSAAALGRVMSISSMMGSMLKDEQEQISVIINGHGPIGSIVVDAYFDGHVRGFVSDPHILMSYNDTNKLAVGKAVGVDGTLEVIKHLHMKDNWKGTVELQSGEIGEDFAYYFMLSEQIPSVVSLGVLVNEDYSIKSAGGLLIQIMPGASEEEICAVEEISKKLKPMSELLLEYDDLESILKCYFNDVQIISQGPVEYRCDCDSAAMKRALTTLPKKERLAMINEDHGCEITCNFCNEIYKFSEKELVELEMFLDKHAKA